MTASNKKFILSNDSLNPRSLAARDVGKKYTIRMKQSVCYELWIAKSWHVIFYEWSYAVVMRSSLEFLKHLNRAVGL